MIGLLRADEEKMAEGKTAVSSVIRLSMAFLGLTVAFGVAYGQFPLFYFTQNQYFFHGLLQSGFGLLRQDWLAGTIDTWPVFTELVHLTYRYLAPQAFYLYFLLLLGVYAYSLVGIVTSLFGLSRSPARVLAFVAAVVALHSAVWSYLTDTLLGVDFRRTFLEGVASQRILWDMLTPSTFGAFLLLSILLFLRGRRLPAVLASAVAVAFHPVYLLGAFTLAGSYMLIVWRRGEGWRRALGLGVLAFATYLPMILFALLTIGRTSPETWHQAQRILVEFRLQHHALPARWIGDVFSKAPLVVLALFLVRGTDLFWIMLLPAAAGIVLTAAQAVSGSTSLALLFPWRVTVFLVPLGTTIVAGYLVSRSVGALEQRFGRARGALVALSIFTLFALVLAGGLVTRRRWQTFWGPESVPLLQFVQRTKQPGEVYLIPPLWRYFRLYSGAPAFVDFLHVPYGDRSVVEWDTRLRLSTEFYRDRLSPAAMPRRSPPASPAASAARLDPARRCRALEEITRRYRVTHVVLEDGDLSGCAGWRLRFRDGSTLLYAAAH